MSVFGVGGIAGEAGRDRKLPSHNYHITIKPGRALSNFIAIPDLATRLSLRTTSPEYLIQFSRLNGTRIDTSSLSAGIQTPR